MVVSYSSNVEVVPQQGVYLGVGIATHAATGCLEAWSSVLAAGQ